MTLDASRWAVLQPLIDQALELDGAARAAFVAGLSRRDAEAARDLAAFLDRADRAVASGSATPPAWLRAAHQSERRVGEIIAGYRIEAELGRGGMGSVWRARALADSADVVAIKLVDVQGAREGVLARFGRERDLLARLDHPHIARLRDAGFSETGEPFLILEYIAGEAIDRWCARHAPDLRTRVRLLEQVADAVQSAHAQLVVHRDLKPNNILVDAEGRAVVLDFGIARLLDHDAADTSITRLHGAAMTPAYAAPEQLRGEPASTAMDVYALGLIAYELVEGRRAFDIVDAPREPVPLARRADADLASIIAKAMAVDPHERYASAREVADDLAAWREHRPIRARPPSLTYRARKFVRRHRGGVAAGMVALLAVIAGVIGTVWQAGIARDEAVRAQAQAARATAYTEILLRVFADPEASGSIEQSGRMLLRGAALLRELGRGDEPNAVADVMGRWASMMPARGLHDEAIDLYASAEQLATDADLRLRITCRRLGVLLSLQDRRQEALDLLDTVRAAQARQPDNPWFAECHRAESAFWRERREFEKALAALDRAEAAYRALPEFESGNRLLVRYSRGMILLRLNRVDAAERALLGALADVEAQGRGDDTTAFSVHYELSSIARRRSDFAAAIDHLDRAIALLATAGDADPQVHGARARLGNLYAWLGRVDEARRLLVDAETKSRDQTVGSSWLESAQLLTRWAIQWGDLDLAQSLIERQRARFADGNASERRAGQYAAYMQAVLDGRRGDLAGAEQGIAAAVAFFRGEGEGGLAQLPRALGELAAVRLQRGDTTGAEAAAREALALDAPAHEAAEWRITLADSLEARDAIQARRERQLARDAQCRIFGSQDARCGAG